MRQRGRRGLFWVASLFALAAAASAALTAGSGLEPGYGRTWADVDYVGDGKTGHLLDIYLPAAGSGPFPVVVGIYGSAWTSDSGKGPFGSALAAMLCPEGFAVVAINHRGTLVTPKTGAPYASGDIFPAQIQDVKAAVRFVRANAAKYGLDADRIAVLGGSSGGHLAALLGTSGDVDSYAVGETTMSIEGTLGKCQTASSRVQAVVDFSGATDFLALNDCYYTKDHNAKDSPASILIGGPIQEHPDECALANPITYVDSADPPFFIAHGDKDPQIPWCQSQKLHDALTAAGVPSTFKLVARAGHTDVGTPETIAAMVAFLKASLDVAEAEAPAASTQAPSEAPVATAPVVTVIEGPPGMVLVPAGSFQMGDSFSEGPVEESPVHTVSVSSFYMDKYPVTKALWKEVADWASKHGYDIASRSADGKAADHPAYNVTWYEAVKWANARSEKEGLQPAYYTSEAKTPVQIYRKGEVDVASAWVSWSTGYRLPTEAEWEKAARGGAVGHRFPWTDTDTIQHARANYDSSGGETYDTSPTRRFHPDFDNGSWPYTSPVGSFAPNGYGLYDMVGNVWEWTWDWYNLGYYSSSPETDPRGPDTWSGGMRRALRGASWGFDASYCRVAQRIGFRPNGSDIDLGFRLVRTTP